MSEEASPTGTVPADWYEKFSAGERRKAWDGFAYLPGEFIERYGTRTGLKFYFTGEVEEEKTIQPAGGGEEDRFAEVWRRGVC